MTFCQKQKTARPLPLIMLLGVLVLAGCATANTGGVRHSSDVKQAFETYHVKPDYRYYFYNQENNPFAVVGLQKDYFIEDPSWRPLDANSDKFKKVIDLVKDFPEGFTQAYGSYILDSQGGPVGMWYSTLAPPGIRVDPETRRVSINAAKPWLRDDDSWWRPGAGVGVGVGVGSGGGSGVGIRMGW